jgi:hypothetical protein
MNARFGVIMGLILTAVIVRIAMAGIPNVSPITALALFSGAYLADRKLALLVPLAAMVIGDLIIGFHDMMFFVYAAFVLISLVGIFISTRVCGHIVIAASLISSVLFFLVTNFGVWMVSGMYPLTFEGLLACYTAAIPFFQLTLLGDLFFVGVIFGGFMLLERLLPTAKTSTNPQI